MSIVKELLGNTDKPINNLLPEVTSEYPIDNLEFRNLTHFKFIVSKLKVKKKSNEEYRDLLGNLLKGVSGVSQAEYESIQLLVKSNLHKRGLITEEVYESFKYADSGTTVGIDVGKYAAGDPECVITPTRQYIDYFHELFISVSYSWSIEDKEVQKSCAKLLATIEELERQHIFIKITLVFPAKEPTPERFFFSSIPLFSHRERKDFHTMASVVNSSLLRVFYFAVLEDFYGESLNSSYGNVVKLKNTMNIGDNFNEIKFFEDIRGMYAEV